MSSSGVVVNKAGIPFLTSSDTKRFAAPFRSVPALRMISTTIPVTVMPPWACTPAVVQPAPFSIDWIVSAMRVTSVVSAYQKTCVGKSPNGLGELKL